jgi:tripartite-type tricarboxylate transporter receptor subunit TctC
MKRSVMDKRFSTSALLRSSKSGQIAVPFAGSSTVLTALMSNQLEMASSAMMAAVTLVKVNKVTALAVISNRRVATFRVPQKRYPW